MVNVLKVYFKDSKNESQIRRMVVSSAVVNKFELLIEKIRSLLQLPDSTNLQIKWKDPEDDFILMSSDDELAQALANAEDSLLRVYVNKKTEIMKASADFENQGELHPLVYCDGCDKEISGVRYKCLQCKNFDICSACNAADEHSHHDMIKLIKPSMHPRQWMFLGTRKLWKSMFGPCPATFTYDFFGRNPSNSSDESPSPPKDNKPPSSSGACKNAFCKSFPGKETPSDSNDDSKSSAKNKKHARESNSRYSSGHPCSDWPNAFLDMLKTGSGMLKEVPPQALFGDAYKLLNEGLDTVIKNVQGNIEVKVDNNPLFKSEFRMGQPKHEAAKDNSKDNNEKQSSPNGPSESETKPSTLREKCAAAREKLGTAHTPDTSTPDVILPKTGEILKEYAPVHPVTSQDPLFAANAFDSISKETYSEPGKEVVCDVVTEAPPPVSNTESCAEGWTFLNGEETKYPEPCMTEVKGKDKVGPRYPILKKLDVQEKQNVLTDDPAIISALLTMQAMGFTNEGGWLERLLISKHGNINEALDALYPLTSNTRP